MKIRAPLFFLLVTMSTLSWSERHHGHSDDLLILLQHKLLIAKLQTTFSKLSHSETKINLVKQNEYLTKALVILNQYAKTPQSHYLDLATYQTSLENRAELLVDYSQLLSKYLTQINEKAISTP